VDYEIPYHRAQAGKLDQQLMDAERRCAEYLRLADSSAAEYRQARHRPDVSHQKNLCGSVEQMYIVTTAAIVDARVRPLQVLAERCLLQTPTYY